MYKVILVGLIILFGSAMASADPVEELKASVAEAVEGAKKIQIRPVNMTHHNIAVVSPMHVAIEDESGDSCIFEYLNGELHVSAITRQASVCVFDR